MPELVLWPVIVDREPNVVLLDELLDARKGLRRRVSGNDHRDTRPLAVLELVADVIVFILRKVDCSRGMQLEYPRQGSPRALSPPPSGSIGR